jgi:uncharacterized membrane protein YtjA (UPF0391 family)
VERLPPLSRSRRTTGRAASAGALRIAIKNQVLAAMLRWALIFFVFGLIAALLGFTTVAGTAIGIAKFLFFVFAALFVLTLLAGFFIGRKILK